MEDCFRRLFFMSTFALGILAETIRITLFFLKRQKDYDTNLSS